MGKMQLSIKINNFCIDIRILVFSNIGYTVKHF